MHRPLTQFALGIIEGFTRRAVVPLVDAVAHPGVQLGCVLLTERLL
jgi:hypothetical protein